MQKVRKFRYKILNFFILKRVRLIFHFLYFAAVNALLKIPTTIRLEDNDGPFGSNDIVLKCIFQLSKNLIS